MKFKSIAGLILIIFCVVGINAQDRVDQIWSEIDSINRAVQPDDLMRTSPWSYNTSIGTSYMFSKSYGPLMNFYAAPHINYSATNRLAFHGGFVASHTFTNLMYPGEVQNSMTGFTNLSVYASASYRLTENLVVHGTGIRSILTFPGEGIINNAGFQDLSVGATLHFGNFSIGASVHRSNNSYNSFYPGSTPFNSGFIPY